VPPVRLLRVAGEPQATSGAPSSEHAVAATVPVEVQAKTTDVAEGDCGAVVNRTVGGKGGGGGGGPGGGGGGGGGGGPGGGGGGGPPVVTMPNSCAQ
jgi:hypothetical protein